MKIAVAHDWLNQMGGAENVLETMISMFPDAPVFTTIYASDLMPAKYRGWDIRASWLNNAPYIHAHHQMYLPFYPLAARSLDVSGYDVVLSNKSGFIHGIKTTSNQTHICYCLAPTRYVWDYKQYAQREQLNPFIKLTLLPIIYLLRKWDYRMAQNVSQFYAISTDIQQRIKKYYHRESKIIYPPVDIARFQPVKSPNEDYYFIVSRLVPYKRIDLAVQAFTRMKKRLVITGDGRDSNALQSLAGSHVKFTGRLPHEQVVELMANCRAFIFPGYEDFGITPVEAQAAGRAVIAFANGGALDTIIHEKTGLFFQEQTVDSLIESVHRFESMDFDTHVIRENAKRFSTERFKRELYQAIQDPTPDPYPARRGE